MPDDLNNLTAEQLAALIEYHNRKYWAEGEPEISDDEYDSLVRALTALEPDHPLLVQVQAPIVAGTGKVVHRKPMLSLDKAYSLEEVISWAKKYARSKQEALIVQPKYDGISALWSEGILATRGDGETGENISDKVELIELETTGLITPLKKYTAPIRGEIVIRDDDFKSLYATIRNKNGRTYKNSRNAVAGIMGLKDIREMLLQHAKLSLIDYRLHTWKTRLDSLADDWQYILEQAEALPYPMDGLVIKLADDSYSESLGNTTHHPRGQIAFKFSGVRQETKLVNVEWSFGKNCLTPVAEVEPVEIGGTTIRHATLHNLQNVLDKDLCIGDTIVIERAGDVIPYIVSSTPGEERRSCIITHCPGCGAELVRDLPELRCTNPDCMETKLQNLTAAVKNIGIERLGEPNIRKMMLALGVKELADIFKLTKNQILSMEGFQNQSAENLLREISNAKTVPDWQLLASLNIKGIGPNIAKGIMRKYTLAELQDMTIEALSQIDGIGPERANALFRELRSQKNILDDLLQCVTLTITKSGNNAEKPRICFTGKMPEKRSFYENLAEKYGYEPADSVNAELNTLVCADVNDNSSKLQKAKKYQIRIVQLDDWLKEIQNQPAEKPAATPETAATAQDKTDDLPLFSFDEKNKSEEKSPDSEPEQLMLGF